MTDLDVTIRYDGRDIVMRRVHGTPRMPEPLLYEFECPRCDQLQRIAAYRVHLKPEGPLVLGGLACRHDCGWLAWVRDGIATDIDDIAPPRSRVTELSVSVTTDIQSFGQQLRAASGSLSEVRRIAQRQHRLRAMRAVARKVATVFLLAFVFLLISIVLGAITRRDQGMEPPPTIQPELLLEPFLTRST